MFDWHLDILARSSGHSLLSSMAKRGRLGPAQNSSDIPHRTGERSDGTVVATRPLHEKTPIQAQPVDKRKAKDWMAYLENLVDLFGTADPHDFNGNGLALNFAFPNSPKASCSCRTGL